MNNFESIDYVYIIPFTKVFCTANYENEKTGLKFQGIGIAKTKKNGAIPRQK